LVWKDPVDLAYSHWKRGSGLTDWRTDFIRSYSRFFKTGLPFLAVNYNALARNPQRQLMAVCAAVGIAFSEGRERFWEKEPHHLFGSAGVRRQLESGGAAIKPRLPYPPAFEAKRPFLEDHVANDVTLQAILATLQKADVVCGTAFPGTRPRRALPLWYYRKRVTRFVRRYVPERYDPLAS
jgi:hypothetical protein